MSKIKIEPPEDDVGKWLYGVVCGTQEPIEIDIPGTGAVADVQTRFGAVFELFELLKEMNQNMVDINDGIDELNKNIKTLGLDDLASSSAE
jgi:hypothetical protein